MLVRALAVALLALLPSVSLAQAPPAGIAPLEVAAAITVCLERGRDQPYALAGRPDEARLYERDWAFAVVTRRRPTGSDLAIVSDPVQPPLVVAFVGRAGAPEHADEAYRRGLARDVSRCLSAGYPPR